MGDRPLDCKLMPAGYRVLDLPQRAIKWPDSLKLMGSQRRRLSLPDASLVMGECGRDFRPTKIAHGAAVPVTLRTRQFDPELPFMICPMNGTKREKADFRSRPPRLSRVAPNGGISLCFDTRSSLAPLRLLALARAL
jgi:hypothetical protein